MRSTHDEGVFYLCDDGYAGLMTLVMVVIDDGQEVGGGEVVERLASVAQPPWRAFALSSHLARAITIHPWMEDATTTTLHRHVIQ